MNNEEFDQTALETVAPMMKLTATIAKSDSNVGDGTYVMRRDRANSVILEPYLPPAELACEDVRRNPVDALTALAEHFTHKDVLAAAASRIPVQWHGFAFTAPESLIAPAMQAERGENRNQVSVALTRTGQHYLFAYDPIDNVGVGGRMSDEIATALDWSCIRALRAITHRLNEAVANARTRSRS
jgi:hypothetical protein